MKHKEQVTNNIIFQLQKDYNVMINGQTFFDQPVKNCLRTYDSIQKIAIGQGDDYTIGCLVDYNCFKNCYKMIAIDLSKQHALDVDSNAYNKLILLGI